MKKYLMVGVLFAFAIFSISAQNHKLKKTVILEGYISISLPEDFKPMSEEDKAVRFRKDKMPSFAVSDEGINSFVAMNVPSEPANETAIPMYLKNYTALFSTFYPSAEVLKSDIRTVNGKQVGCIEFTAMDAVEEVYHCFFFTNLEGKLLTFDFVCPKEEKEEWANTVADMVASLEVK